MWKNIVKNCVRWLTAEGRNSPRPQRRQARPSLEALEDRTLLTATYFILDFTPDSHAGSFADTFARTWTASGYAPTFLDFNGDRRVDSRDVSIAAGQIASKVQSFFAPFLNRVNN